MGPPPPDDPGDARRTRVSGDGPGRRPRRPAGPARWPDPRGLTWSELGDALWLASRSGFGSPASEPGGRDPDAAPPGAPVSPPPGTPLPGPADGGAEAGNGTAAGDGADDGAPGDGADAGDGAGAGNGALPAARGPRAAGDAPTDIARPAPDRSASRYAVLAPDRPPATADSVAPGEAELARAFRPLRERVPSAYEVTLDEEATAERAAEDHRWLPVLRPAGERRWELVLVVDDSPSMVVWASTIADFGTLLRNQGTFRDVRVRRFDAARPDHLLLRGQPGGVPVGPGGLVDPSGRRLVLVLTDGWAAGWQAGTAQSALASWARTMSVAIVHMLPQPSWYNTAIRPVRVRLRGAGPRVATGSLTWAPARGSPDDDLPAGATAVPVLEFGVRWLRRWAKLVSSATDWMTVPALLVPPGGLTAEHLEPPAAGPPAGAGHQADKLVARFRAMVSPLAATLASRLAAAPLNVATMRAVQRTLPRSGPTQLSEVLTSGLVRPVVAADEVTDPARITFEFHPGVREELLAFSGRARTVEVVSAVEGELGAAVEAVRGLTRRVTQPGTADAPEVNDRNAPYLWIEQVVLQALSGSHLLRSRALRRELHKLHNPPGEPSLVESGMSGTLSEPERAPAPTVDPLEPGAGVTTAVRESGYGPAQGGISVSSLTLDQPAGRGAQAKQPAIVGNLPPRNPNFTGRGEMLETLHRRMQSGTTAVLPEALHGMGGVGKSQLVAEYVYRHQSDYDVIWWISAERPAQISSALVELAQRLELPVASTANTAVPAVREALRLGRPHANWLLIFDNAENPKEVRDFFPVGGPGNILVTSRNSQWAGVANTLEVDVFDRGESVELLMRRGPHLLAGEADELAAALGDLPLAIEQAAAWRAETGMPVVEYLRLLEENRPDVLDDPDQAPLDYPTSVAAAWNVSLEALKVRDPAALRLLQVCAFFASEPIAKVLLSSARGVRIDPQLDTALRDPIRLNRAIRTINRYALARIDHKTNSIQMHRLVQRVLIGQMTEADQENLRHGAHLMLAANDPNQPDSPDHWPRYAELYPHVVASGAIECPDAYVRDLIQNEAQYLWRWGRHDEARDVAEQAYQAWTAALGEEHPDTLKMARTLGWMYFVVGDFHKAAAHNARTYELYERSVGKDHEEAIWALGAVAADHRVAGNFAGALEQSEVVYRRSSRNFGEDDPNTLNAAHNLAVSLRLSGEFVRARNLDEQTLARKVEIFGADYLDTLLTLGGLNLDRRELGDYIGARNEQEGTVASYRRLLRDDDHAELLRQSRDLSVARRKAGDHEGALALSGDVRRRYLSRYGPDHPDTVLANLTESINLRTQASPDLRTARELGKQVTEQLGRILDRTHPHTASAAVNLAVTLRLLGDADAARALDEESLRHLVERVGDDHPLVLAGEINLASDLYAQGEYQAAHDRDVATLERCRTLLGTDHPTTLACFVNLAMDLRAIGRTGEADTLFADVLVRFDQALGPDHPATLAARNQIRANCDIDPMPL